MKKIVVSVIILLILCIVIFLQSSIVINLIGDEEVYINVNEKYFETGYKTSYLIKNLDNKVKVHDNIDITQVGKYEVKYTLKYLGKTIQKVRKVNVVDSEAPVIKLQGDTTVYVNINHEYEDPGYIAYDNFDKKIIDRVIINSNVDTSKIGKYEITYTLSDLSGNSTTVKRNVEVINSNILSSQPKDFWLDGMYSDIVLKPNNKEYEYIDDMVILGDSNIRYLYTNGEYLNAHQVWGKDNLNAVELTTAKVLIHQTNKEMYVDEALDKYSPKYLVVSFGFGSSLNLGKKEFIDYAERFIKQIQNDYPNTKLMVVSLPPIVQGTLYDKFQNKTNQFNYYLLELCAKYKVGFINIADELKDQTGYGDAQYFVCSGEYDCGFHLNKKGKQLYVNYLKRIDMEKEIEK